MKKYVTSFFVGPFILLFMLVCSTVDYIFEEFTLTVVSKGSFKKFIHISADKFSSIWQPHLKRVSFSLRKFNF